MASKEYPASIEVEGLVKQFKKGPRAVDGIDLHVDPGEIYGFLGPNGAGKSTTVLMLTTLLPPDEGTARVAGYEVRENGAKVRENIGAALQEAALDPFLTAREHMRLQTALHGLPEVRAPPPRRRADRARGPVRSGRPHGRRLLRRHEAAARPGAGAGARPADPVPGRAHHRPRPAEPHRVVGGGRAPVDRRTA